LTTANPDKDTDAALFAALGIRPMGAAPERALAAAAE
jgi:hypothetical protein